MDERTYSQMFYEDKLSLRDIARKRGIPDDKGAVFHLRNPKTGEREKHALNMSEGVEKPKPRNELPKKSAGKAGKKSVVPEKPVKKSSKEVKKSKEPTYKEKFKCIKDLTKKEQMDILKNFGLSWYQRSKFKYEDQRVKKILELQSK